MQQMNVVPSNRFGKRTSFTCFALAILVSVVFAMPPVVFAQATTATQPASIRVREHRDLKKLEERVQRAVSKTLEATVSVQVGRGTGQGYAFGSGVIISDDGYVLTAAHVSSQPNQSVTFRLRDGSSAKGVTLGLHKDLDMGLMKITDSDRIWPSLKRARSSKLKNGDWVIATGHPGGFDKEAKAIVRLGRVLKNTTKVILTDCTLVGGDSGGPLVDLNGNVVGIHSRIGSDLATNLHVPIDRFAENWDRLASRDVWGHMTSIRPWIGVEHNNDYDEAYVKDVRSDSPAARVNLQFGDKIIEFDGKAVRSFDQLKRLVAKQDPGDRVKIQYERNGTLFETPIDIGSKKTQQDSPTRDDADLLKGWHEQRRGRGVVGIGKNADQVKESFHDVLKAASEATVEVLDSGKVVSLGTIVDKRLILTKASQIRGKHLRCRFRNTRSFKVEKIAELRSHDLALLKASRDLPAVKLRAASVPQPGALLASSGLNVWPLAIGVASNTPTEIPSEGKLGIRMDDDQPIVADLIPGSGAETVGIRKGDLITKANGTEISFADDLVGVVRDHYPGDVLQLTVQRGEESLVFSVELIRHSEFDDALADFEDFLGGRRNERRTGFARILQHDTAIHYLNCGGPVVDVNGKFVGINIARAARTTSYLLPASEVRIALKELRAQRNDNLVTVDVTNVNK